MVATAAELFEPLKSLTSSATATWMAAARTATYGVASALLRSTQVRPTAAQRDMLWQFWREAFELQRQQLARREVRQAVAAVERRELRSLPLFLASLPFDMRRAAQKRRGKRRDTPVRPRDGFVYPDYYLHDFHNQHNGGLSWRSAATYEWQIRLLFAGTNRLMRQRVIDALPRGDHLRILDIGCGPGTWVPLARLQGRDHHVTGIDLSPAYLGAARRQGAANTTFLQMNGESLPDHFVGTFDAVVCIWLYHELPPAAQKRITHSMARALRPGGTVLFMDAMQQRDVPDRDISFINERFAADFDEPYYAAYQTLDLPAHFRAAGLEVAEQERAYVSNFYRLTKDAQ